MKTKIQFLLANFLFLFFLSSCSTKQIKGSVNIMDVTGSETPSDEMIAMIPNDIAVSKIMFLGEKSYEVKMYVKELGKLVSHAAIYSIEKDFDKAEYIWIDENLVEVRLFNITTNEDCKFKIFGKGQIVKLILEK